MRILLIYTEKGSDNYTLLRELLEKKKIRLETLAVKSSEDTDIKQFTGFFESVNSGGKDEHQMDIPDNESLTAGIPKNNEQGNEFPTHVVILSPLSRKWFDFLAGFSCGSHVPLLVYGHDAIAGISKEFSAFFTFLESEVSLQTYLEAEYEAFKKQEAAREIIRAQQTLLHMGIPVNGESLAQCVSEGHIREVSYFLAAGFSPDTRNKAGVPLLNIAARKGNREIMRYLIMAGAQLNLKADDRGTSALSDGVMGKHSELVIDLINAGVDVNIKSKDGQTALIVAVGACEEKVVEALLKAGADPDISDSLGASARKYAALFNKKAILDLFETYASPKPV